MKHTKFLQLKAECEVMEARASATFDGLMMALTILTTHNIAYTGKQEGDRRSTRLDRISRRKGITLASDDIHRWAERFAHREDLIAILNCDEPDEVTPSQESCARLCLEKLRWAYVKSGLDPDSAAQVQSAVGDAQFAASLKLSAAHQPTMTSPNVGNA